MPTFLEPIVSNTIDLVGKLPTFFLVLCVISLIVFIVSKLLNAALVFTDRVVGDKIDNGARTGLVKVMRGFGYVAAFYFAFQSVDLTGGEAVAAVMGSFILAIGLGAQDLARDAIGGIFMLVDKDIDPNLPLDIAGKVGALTKRGIFTIRLQTTDNRTHIVRNRHFLSDYTIMGRDVDVRMTYGINNDRYVDFKRICSQMHVDCPFTSKGAEPEFASDPDKVIDGSGSTHFFDSNVPTADYWHARQWYDEHLTPTLQEAGILSVFDIGGTITTVAG